MAIIAKTTFVINLSRWGWTETYYWVSGSSGLSGAKSAALELLGLRMACMSKGCNVDGVRITDVSKPGSTISIAAAGTNFGVTTLADQEPWAAFLVGMSAVGALSGLVYRREFLMRGIPFLWNGWTSAQPTFPALKNGGDGPVTSFLTALTGTSFLYAGQWCIKATNRDPATNIVYPLGTVAVVQPGSFFSFTADGGFTGGVGDSVHIGKAKGYGIGGLVGNAIIMSAPLGGPYVTNRRQCGPVQTVIITKPGIVRHNGAIYVPISQCIKERWVKRDTGRPFAVTVGRRRSRSC